MCLKVIFAMFPEIFKFVELFSFGIFVFEYN